MGKRLKYRAILKQNCFSGAFRKNPARFLNRFFDKCILAQCFCHSRLGMITRSFSLLGLQ